MTIIQIPIRLYSLLINRILYQKICVQYKLFLQVLKVLGINIYLQKNKLYVHV